MLGVFFASSSIKIDLYRLNYIVFLVLIFASCKKDVTVWKTDNLNGNKIQVFGHGGLGELSKYPMNSLESLTGALDEGADGTEMDLDLSKDNVLVLYHHEKLQDGTHCDGLIRSKTWDELKNCKYKLPLLSKASLINASQFFEKVQNKKKYVFTFDCKLKVSDDKDFLNRYANALYTLLSSNQILENSFIESYSIDFLKVLHEKDSQLKLFIHADNYNDALDASKQVVLYGITMDRVRISKKEIAEAHKQQLRVTLFNTDTESTNIAAVEMNPDFIQTDKVEYLVEVLKKQ